MSRDLSEYSAHMVKQAINHMHSSEDVQTKSNRTKPKWGNLNRQCLVQLYSMSCKLHCKPSWRLVVQPLSEPEVRGHQQCKIGRAGSGNIYQEEDKNHTLLTNWCWPCGCIPRLLRRTVSWTYTSIRHPPYEGFPWFPDGFSLLIHRQFGPNCHFIT